MLTKRLQHVFVWPRENRKSGPIKKSVHENKKEEHKIIIKKTGIIRPQPDGRLTKAAILASKNGYNLLANNVVGYKIVSHQLIIECFDFSSISSHGRWLQLL